MLGLVELFLLFVIFTILLGPAIGKTVKRYQVRYRKRNQRLERVAQQRRAEELARKEARDAKIKIVVCSITGALVLFGLIYFAFWPVSYPVNAYQLTSAQAIDASFYAGDSTLDAASSDTALQLLGSENVTQIRFYDDWIYAAVSGGKIVRVRENDTGLTEVVSTGGEIMGFDFDAEGNIIFTDAAYTAAGGALLKASFDGFAVTVTPLVTDVMGQSLTFPAGVEVAADGTIYFLNATSVSLQESGSAAQAMRTAQIAHTTDGVLYAYNPETASCEMMATGLCFGVGLALSEAEDCLYLSQFADQSIWSVALSARQTTLGAADTAVFAAALGAYPTGLSLAEDGTLWVAFYAEEMAWLEKLNESVAWREVLLRLPSGTREWLLAYNGQTQVAAFAADGSLVANYKTERSKTTAQLTDVCVVNNRVYLAQGNRNDWIAYLE